MFPSFLGMCVYSLMTNKATVSTRGETSPLSREGQHQLKEGMSKPKQAFEYPEFSTSSRDCENEAGWQRSNHPAGYLSV